MKSLIGSRVLSRIHQSRYLRRATTSFPPVAPITHPVLTQSSSSQQHRCASSSKTPKVEDEDAPVRYTSSKALNWSVENSFGKHKKQPWYKVAPISIALTVFIAWIFLREETDIDRQLEKTLYERLPNMFPPPAEAPEDEDLLSKEDENTRSE